MIKEKIRSILLRSPPKPSIKTAAWQFWPGFAAKFGQCYLTIGWSTMNNQINTFNVAHPTFKR